MPTVRWHTFNSFATCAAAVRIGARTCVHGRTVEARIVPLLVHPGTVGPASLMLPSLLLQISTVLGSAVKDQREESAWSEGVAIWVAVIVVSGVGEYLSSASPPG